MAVVETTAKKPQRKAPSFTKLDIYLDGKIKFSNLKEPNRMFATEQNPYGSFQAVIVFPEESDTMKIVKELYEEAIQAEKELLPEHRRKSAPLSPFNVKDDEDRDHQPTGLMQLKLKRHERLGRPGVIDTDGKTELDTDFIRSGSDVRVHVTAESYNVAGKIGVSLKLENIQVLHEAEGGSFSPKPKAHMFKPVNLDDSPLA